MATDDGAVAEGGAARADGGGTALARDLGLGFAVPAHEDLLSKDIGAKVLQQFRKTRQIKLQAKADMSQLLASKQLANAGTPEQIHEHVMCFLDDCIEEARAPPPPDLSATARDRAAAAAAAAVPRAPPTAPPADQPSRPSQRKKPEVGGLAAIARKSKDKKLDAAALAMKKLNAERRNSVGGAIHPDAAALAKFRAARESK